MVKMSFKNYLRCVYWFWAKVYDGLIDSLFNFDRKKTIQQLKIIKKALK